MTNKKRSRKCKLCDELFIERYSDSNDQWDKREYCSIKCNNSSPSRSKCIFLRMKEKQIIRDGCWGWSGSKDDKGYGVLSNRNGSSMASGEKAHRVSYEYSKGKIAEGLVVRHSCDNPECTNPDHLDIGTQKENMQDMVRRGRMNPKSLENLNHDRKLSDEQVLIISNTKFAGRNGRGGITKKELAEAFGVHPDTIFNELKRIQDERK